MKRRRARTRLPRSVPVGQARRNLSAVQRFRLDFVFLVLLVSFAVLIARLGKLQLVDAATHRSSATKAQHGSGIFRGLRGRILDTRGRTLATSRRIVHVAADPVAILEPKGATLQAFARRLALLLDLEDGGRAVYRKLKAASPKSRYVPLIRGIEDERLLATLLDYVGSFKATVDAGHRGLIVEAGEKRTYPNGDYAKCVLGCVADPSRGCEARGLEETCNDALRGERMKVPYSRGRGKCRGCFAKLMVDPLAASGRDVRLTLDVVIQHYAEKALDELCRTWEVEEACAIVLEPETGHVLALANRHPHGVNIAVDGVWPPGSMFKPMVVALGLKKQVVRPDEVFDLPAAWPFHYRSGTRVIHDVHDNGTGTVVEMIARSSNTGLCRILWRLMTPAGGGEPATGPAFRMFQDFGFGTKTGVEIEAAEIVMIDRSSSNPLFPTLGFAIGRHFAISPLRLLCCYAGLGREDARIVRPTLLPGRGGGRKDLPRLCGSPEDLLVVREGLGMTAEDGTAARVFRGAAYTIGAKTGTADLNGVEEQISSLVAFAPLDKPRFAVVVAARVSEEIRHPETGAKPYGGAVSGPAVRAILDRSFAYLDGGGLLR